ncbi:MAG TPA: AMP-binding protein [Caulobacteraceae bacterium]|nr:AMP-binding protein [Caulobacteraceae bacterium]
MDGAGAGRSGSGALRLYVVEKIREFAERTPDAPALIADLQPVSYRAFDRAIGAMRRRLAAESGLGPRSTVVCLIDPLPLAWIADLALRSLGHATIALRSASELAALRGLRIAALATGEGQARVEAGGVLGPDVARIEVGPDLLAAGDGPASAAAEPDAGAPGAHVLLTSATTGRYKLVQLAVESEDSQREEHRQLYLSSGANLRDDRDALCVHLMNLGLWTAGGYNTPLLAWSRGGCAVFHQGREAHRSFALPALTHAIATPAYLAELVRSAPGALARNDALQIITVGGTPSLSLLGELRARLTSRIATALGSTESGTWAVTAIETADDLRWHRLHPARRIEVVDDEDRPVGQGVLGRVRVRLTNGVTGYLNDAAASAAVFRDGWFYPGDLGVLDGRGRLALMGRTTEVLEVLGEKRPAAPLEEALGRALGLDGVCVLAERGANLEDELHVVLETPTPIEPALLDHAAQAHVRGFARVHFHFLERLPRNHMGKIERLKLKQSLLRRRAAADPRAAG